MSRAHRHAHASRGVSGRSLRLFLAIALVSVGLPTLGLGGAVSASASPGLPGEPVRLIVEMDLGSTVPRGGMAAMSMGARRAAVGSRAAEVTAELGQVGAEVTTTFAAQPYLAVSVDARDLPALAALPGVASIAPDEQVTLHLDESLPPIGATGPVPSYVGADLDGSTSAIAVIDTGVDRDHGFFSVGGASRVVAEACFSSVGDCAGGTAQEDFGTGAAAPLAGSSHGTHVAGIAAGAGDGSGPAQGVAPRADIVAVQAFSVGTDGLVSYISDLTKGLEFVLDQHTTTNGIDVAAVNLSLGSAATDTCNGYGSWDVFSAVVDDLRAADVLTVAAAGNDGNHGAMGAPACLENVVSVGATDDDASIAWFSDLSADTDLVAPGVGITSSVPGGGYGTASGTSMAAPHVSGAVALLRHAAPATPIGQLLPALTTSETLVDDDRSGGTVTGLPFLDLPKALTALPGHPSGPSAPDALAVTAGDAAVGVTWTAPDAGAGIEQYDLVSRPGGRTCRTVGSPPATGCTITGLDNGTAYTFTAIASNASGPGPSSPASAEVVPGVPSAPSAPSAPTDVLASGGIGEATVSWHTPADDGGSPVVEYQVTSDPGAQICTSREPVSAPETSCVVTGLTNGTAYTFTVTATNDAGTGPASAPTPEIVPSDGGDGGSGGGGDDGGGGGGGFLPPPEDEPAGADPEPGTTDGSRPSQQPGTSTLLIDGEPASTEVTSTDESLTVSGDGFSLTLSPRTSTGEAKPSMSGTTMGLHAGGGIGVAFDGLEGGSTIRTWLFSDPVLLGSSPVSSGGSVDDTVWVPTATIVGEHTVQVAGVLADGRSVSFDLGVEVTAAIGFPDVDGDATHGASILRLAELGVVSGFADGTYGPGEVITRGQIAAFLARALRSTPGDPSAFSDVVGTTHAWSIGAIASSGIAGGYGDGTYRPGEQVTRGQMATFLSNAVELAEVADGPFVDTAGNAHEGTINAVAGAGIASGYPDDTYRPAVSITRAQMASLIAGMLDHLDAGY